MLKQAQTNGGRHKNNSYVEASTYSCIKTERIYQDLTWSSSSNKIQASRHFWWMELRSRFLYIATLEPYFCSLQRKFLCIFDRICFLSNFYAHLSIWYKPMIIYWLISTEQPRRVHLGTQKIHWLRGQKYTNVACKYRKNSSRSEEICSINNKEEAKMRMFSSIDQTRRSNLSSFSNEA